MTAELVPDAPRLRVVDDEPTQREMLQLLLRRAGFQVTVARDGQEALNVLERQSFHLVLSDQRMPGIDGLELLVRVREARPDQPFVLMTAYGSVESAVAAMKRGAADYLTKPFNKDELLLVLERVLRQRRLQDEVEELRNQLSDRSRLSGLIGVSAPMRAVFERIERVAGTDASVLVTGESGTGKELVARAIHDRSKRAAGPFVAVNCAAIPDALLETEFFGHEKGAFTGAIRARPGAFESAQGGTLLLDEIGAMRVDLQAKLLRALQEREVQRLGAEKPVAVDVRVIAATSEDLDEAIANRSFREDLYYRLNVVPIEVPPLRDRSEDIPLLLDAFARRAAARHDRPVHRIHQDVVERCCEYAWPGNVRELQNVVERMVVLARGEELGLDDLPEAIRASSEPTASARTDALALPNDGVSLAELERKFIVEALARSKGSLGPAARMLALSYKTLQYRVRKYRIEKGEYLSPG
ncbi:MAG: sigma-54-dependent Fis family transcriptional regulator [Planctomycetes bacterium]|nr:sigma-54-dependent Fis family transcriptional regulator [Planctomycetota bacterium]